MTVKKKKILNTSASISTHISIRAHHAYKKNNVVDAFTSGLGLGLTLNPNQHNLLHNLVQLVEECAQ